MNKGTFDLYHTNLETTPYGKVFQSIVAKDGFSNNIIENYDNEVLVNMKNVIEETVIPTSYGTVHFKNVTFSKPKTQSGGKTLDLTPRMSREKLIPYFGDIYVDIVHRNNPEPLAYIDGIPIFSSTKKEDDVDINENFKIGSIPIMLGSKLCHLHGKTPEEKFQMGECFNDPLGYFIIKSERVIINQENLRFSTFLIYNLTKDVKDNKCTTRGVITCPTKQGTKVTNIVICKHSSLSLMLHHTKKSKEPLNLFLVYRILGMKMKDTIDQILSFIDEKHHQKVKFKLASTIANYKTYVDEDEDVEVLKKRVLDIRRNEQKLTLARVVEDIEEDLLSNIKGASNKLLHLSMYTARMLEYMIDVRKLDDRDNFGNKRIATPGRSLFNLFKGVWFELTRYIKEKMDPSIKTAKQVSNIIKITEIRDQLIRAFGPNAWGVKRSYRKENITESLKRDTPLAVYSQIGRISAPASRQSKNVVVRMPHASQLGYVCLWETPEGEGCGLIKNFATSCYVSLERNSADIINIIKNDTNLNGFVFQNKDYQELVPLLVNGVIEGWCVPENTASILRSYKIQGFIEKDVCIFYNRRDNCLEINCDGGRPCRPLFVVDEEGDLSIDKLNMWNASVDELVKAHCIEYVDAREQEWVYLAETIDKVNIRKTLLNEKKLYKNSPEKLEEINNKLEDTLDYQYCEIDPTAQFSISANLIPQANRQAGPRTSYQSSMSRQALTQYHSCEHLRFDASYKMMYYPTKALFQTDIQDTSGLNAMSNGQMLQVAILAHPDNPEDGIIFKEEAIEYGNKLDICKKFTFTSDIKSVKSEYVERFAKPPIKPGEPEGRYDAIDEKGIPKLDAFIRQGDCIIGKIKEINKNVNGAVVGEIENLSEYAGVGEEGYVDRVIITTTDEKNIMIKVKLRKNRKYKPGDKMALRYSQKGTVARVIPARELPRVAHGPLKGTVPDVLINPHSQPSRMTMNMIIEILVNKAACINGKFYNATTFRNFEKDFEEIQQTLQDYGLDPMGNEVLEFPGGKAMKSKCFMGPCFYQALRHHVDDKIQMRARKGVKPSTRQPLSGRSNEGGLKVGEMERDALISHGSSALLRERLMDCSDIYTLPICATCGNIAITKNLENDSNPNICKLCGPKAKIGVITIPYVIKLLMFYLNAANINLTFKTKEIVSQNNKIDEEFLV